MRCRVSTRVGVVSAFLALWFLSPVAQTQELPQVTKADLELWAQQLSNWGRWGKEDQLGAVNLITPQKRKQAAALVAEGLSVSLAHDLETEKSEYNPRPLIFKLLLPGGADKAEVALDSIELSYHGFAHTHLDALCHVFPGGKMYNGFGRDQLTSQGAAKDSIIAVKAGVFTRGILFDLPELKGQPYLEPGEAIYPADLDAWERMAGLKVSSGDVIFIRTGRWSRQKRVGPWDVSKRTAGLHASCLKWVRERDVAMIGSDATADVVPSGVAGVGLPIHAVAIPAFGVHLFDNCDLEELSQTAAKYKRWEFLLSVAPLPVVGGTGSPVNPIATY